jgi:ABC-type amino acid transport system permease subunit
LKLPFLIVENEWRVISPPLTLIISPITFNQSLEIAIFFNLVESSGTYVFKEDKPSRVPRAKVVSYALGTYMVCIDRVVVKTSKGGHSIEN